MEGQEPYIFLFLDDNSNKVLFEKEQSSFWNTRISFKSLRQISQPDEIKSWISEKQTNRFSHEIIPGKHTVNTFGYTYRSIATDK